MTVGSGGRRSSRPSLFAFALAGGILAVRQDPALGQEILAGFRDQVAGEILSDTSGVLFLKIFLNNLVACIALFLGGATFGLLPLLVIASNGLVIGGIIETIRGEKGTGFVLAAILPHGVLEIPAFLDLGRRSGSCSPRPWAASSSGARGTRPARRSGTAGSSSGTWSRSSPSRPPSRHLLRRKSYS